MKSKKNKEAFYITTRFQIEFEETKQQREYNETISELEKYFRFNTNIIKFLTISISKDEIA